MNSICLLPILSLMIYNKHLFYALMKFQTPFQVWVSFQHFILCAFSVGKYLQEFISCEVFAGIISSFFSCQPLSSQPAISSMTAFHSTQISLPVLARFISLLQFLLCWPTSSFSCSFWLNIMWSFTPRPRGNTDTWFLSV